MLRRTHPLPKILGVRERNAASDDARLVPGLTLNITRPRDNDLVSRPNLATYHLDLISDQQPQILDILALPPSARDNIPLDNTSKRVP